MLLEEPALAIPDARYGELVGGARKILKDWLNYAEQQPSID
jgi:hypothetical protein